MSNTIQKKLVRSTTRVLGFAFLIVLAMVVGLNIWSSQRNTLGVTKMIQKSLEAKGRILVQNNSLALSGMVADNAFLGVQELVSRTVLGDSDVIYGIFMDANRKTWIFADESQPERNANQPIILEDSLSRWASRQSQPAMTPIPMKPFPWIEFNSPVFVEGEIAGYIRYGLTTAAMVKAAEQARKANSLQMLAMLLGVLLVGMLVFIFSYLAIRRESRRLSQPIILLDSEAKVISSGQYSNPVHVESDDEIGALAKSFEEMRKEVKRYADHLEEIIAEKMQQVRDILDHIDQGLFTVNLDGTINHEYSRATEEMLVAQQLHSQKIQDVLGMSLEQRSSWDDWVTLVQRRSTSMRWEKLTRLSPVQEIPVEQSDGKTRILHFEFQQIRNKDGLLVRLMILVQDVTEARRIERIVKEEQARHENEVRTILGLVNTVPELIQEFFRDIDNRLRNVERIFALVKANHQLDSFAPTDVRQFASAFRDLHTIKGNASSYGFEELGHLAHAAEDALERLRDNIGQDREEDIESLTELLQKIQHERKNIDDTARMLNGGIDGMMVSISERKIVHIQRLARTLLRETAREEHNPYAPLLISCDQLRRVPFGKLVDKFSTMVERLSSKLGKKIAFQSTPQDLEVEPMLVVGVNDILVQLIRNAIDHGVEMPEVRRLRGKSPEGHIWLIFRQTDESIFLEIHDDGVGIDPDAVADKAISSGMITTEELDHMDRRTRMDLVFLPGFTSRDQVSEVSGRGVGLDVVRRELAKLGGSVALESVVGKGSVFRIEVPRKD